MSICWQSGGISTSRSSIPLNLGSGALSGENEPRSLTPFRVLFSVPIDGMIAPQDI